MLAFPQGTNRPLKFLPKWEKYEEILLIVWQNANAYYQIMNETTRWVTKQINIEKRLLVLFQNIFF
jgi:hypothetical protein